MGAGFKGRLLFLIKSCYYVEYLLCRLLDIRKLLLQVDYEYILSMIYSNFFLPR